VTARRSVTFTLFVGLVAGFATTAKAEEPTKQQCIAANENAQSLRQARKLRATRDQLLICISKACPGPVRDDCTERLSEVDKATPSIVFSAKGADGNDLAAVKVTIDGALLLERLDGSAVAVEPGEHSFELTTKGAVAITRKLLIGEGVKGRSETVTFVPAPATIAPAPVVAASTPTAPPATVPDKPANGSNTGSRRTIAYVLGGAGVIGIGIGSVLGLVAKSTYDSAVKSCDKQFSCNGDGYSGGQDAHTQATISTVAFIAGGALLAGGVIVYLTAPKDGAVNVQTTAGAGQLGLRVGGAW
jgi:hypothetical protein